MIIKCGTVNGISREAKLTFAIQYMQQQQHLDNRVGANTSQIE